MCASMHACVCACALMRASCACSGSAESYLNECYANCSAIHGPHHPRSLMVQDELARLLIRTDRHEVLRGSVWLPPPLLSLFVFLPLCLSISLYISRSLSFALCVCLSLCIYRVLCLSPSLSVYLFVDIAFFVFRPVCLSLCIYLVAQVCEICEN